MKPLPHGINDSTVIEMVTQNIEKFLTGAQVREAATLAISFLSSNDNDEVGSFFSVISLLHSWIVFRNTRRILKPIRYNNHGTNQHKNN